MDVNLNQIIYEQIRNKKFSHAYIFEGKDSKELENNYMALIKGSLVHNQYLENKFLEDSLPDLYIIEAEKNIISIDQIRNLSKKIFEKPLESRYKAFIIKDAHKMRKEAQNALLKTLEEPPVYGIIILITDNKYKLLDTILSRCQIISIQGEVNDGLEASIKQSIDSILISAYDKDIHKIINFKKITSNKDLDKINFLLYIEDRIMEIIKFKKGIVNYSNGSFNYRKLSSIPSFVLERLIIEIENIRQLLYVNINFQLAIEKLLFIIAEEGQW